MKKRLYAAMQADFDRRIAKIITAVNQNTKRAGVSANHSVSSASSNFFETYKRNMDDQEKLPGGLFESSKQLQIFTHDFKIAMHGRLHWKKILHIMTKSGVKFILTDFMLIDEADLKEAQRKRTQEESTAAKNMYIALWKSFARPIKTAMQTIADDNDTDGPALLYHLLRQYTGTAESVIRTYQLSLNNLPEKLAEMKFDVDKFCDYSAETLKTLRDAGGDDSQASLKLYEALVSSKVDAFNSEIRAYKAAIAAKDKPLDFTKLLTIARAEYTSLVMRGQWPNVQSSVSKKRALDDIVALKAELKKKDKIIKSYKLATPSSTNKHTIRHTNKETKHVSKSVSDYRPEAQVGKGKDFTTKADFFAWKHTPPKDGNIYCLSNGLRWTWCTKCESWGSHEVTSCRRSHPHSNRLPSKQAYMANKSNKGDPIEIDSVALSNSGDESDNTSVASNSAFLSSKDINE